jgi:ribosomal protein S18 acetylase RimI-like enzyme
MQWANTADQQLPGALCAVGARLELQVARHKPAQRLYQRLGFEVVAEDAVFIEVVWRAADRAQ